MAQTKRREKAKRHGKRRAWEPMMRGPVNPDYLKNVYPEGIGHYGIEWVEAWDNDIYSAVVEHRPDGWAHVSFKRKDRHPIRDWRHVQSIKNECVGMEREAVEIFPAESRLLDEANQYHLFVAPVGVTLPFGQHWRSIGGVVDRRNDPGKARQRDWQPGLSTGPDIDLPYSKPETARRLDERRSFTMVFFTRDGRPRPASDVEMRTYSFRWTGGKSTYYCAECGKAIEVGTKHWVDYNGGIVRLHEACGTKVP